jgi:hypothetical protein
LPLDDAAVFGYLHRATTVWAALASDGAPGARARAVLADLAMTELVWRSRSGAVIDPALWVDAVGAAERTRDDPDAMDHRPGAARALVELADLHLSYEEGRFTATHGKLGLAPRDRSLRPPLEARVAEELPPPVAEAVRARDAVVRISPGGPVTADALTEAAGLLFAYGHAREATAHLSAALAIVCKKDDGFRAFARAAAVARAGKDALELARLAALNADPATTCAKSPAEAARGRALTRVGR